MKTCPVCKSTVYEYKGTCQYCGLDLRLVKWRNESVMAIGLAILLGALASYLTNYSVVDYRYIPVDGTIIAQRYITYPYAGQGVLPGFIAALLFIAGVPSAIYYDLRISRYSRKVTPPSAPPPIAAHELEMKHCMHCGQQTSVNAVFCEKCGGRLS